jgi:hypothetical protein
MGRARRSIAGGAVSVLGPGAPVALTDDLTAYPGARPGLVGKNAALLGCGTAEGLDDIWVGGLGTEIPNWAWAGAIRKDAPITRADAPIKSCANINSAILRPSISISLNRRSGPIRIAHRSHYRLENLSDG